MISTRKDRDKWAEFNILYTQTITTTTQTFAEGGEMQISGKKTGLKLG